MCIRDRVYRIRRAGAALLYATDLLALGEEEWAVLREAPLDVAVLDMTLSLIHI